MLSSFVHLKPVLVLVIFLVINVSCFSYNINARSEFAPAPSIANNHSYFGYSVLLRGGKDPIIIVGAPRDTSRFKDHAEIKDPGTIYYCKISADGIKNTCIQKVLDPTGNTNNKIANGKSYHHRKDSMWLGMSIDGSIHNNGTIVMCAPRWINQFHKDHYLANGLCYTVADTLNMFDSTKAATLIPLVDQLYQGFHIREHDLQSLYGSQAYYYAFGEAGMSAKLSDDGTELLLGAPGVFVWTGTVIRYKITKQIGGVDYFIKQNIPNPYYTPDLKDNSYFGYSVGFGKFISNNRNYYVAGAPRSADLKGEIIIFDFPPFEESRYLIKSRIEGKQIGEYFGSVFATIDINRDGLTDLIIGAPMHAQPLAWDQGKVYVYMNHDNWKFVEQDANICGSFREAGRFGSAISEIGDINGDGFTDVAIGSPYENYGNGAVYIYLGTANGLDPVYSQRISMLHLKGFGISISKGVDIDQNTCNDLAIGSYVSAKVVLLRCHPSIRLIPRIESIPSELSLNITSFTTQICLKAIGNNLFKTDIEVKLAIDSDYRRAVLENSDDSSIIMSEIGVVTEVCKDVVVLIEPKAADFSRPIDIKITYDLKRNPLLESKFCPDCPVIRPTGKREMSIQVPFASGCANATCYPNLKLSADILSEEPFIIGSKPSITVEISLENLGEPAFVPKIHVIQPEKTPILKVPSQCHLENNLIITCDFENPLANFTQKFLLLEFDTSLLTSSDKEVTFNITASSGGEEVDDADNNVFITLELRALSKVEILGSASTDQYVYINPSLGSNQNVTITHLYDVLNNGPTTVDLFTIKFYFPIAYYDNITDANYTLVKVHEPVANLNGQPLICNPITGSYFDDKADGYNVDLTDSIDDDPNSSAMRSRRNIISSENIETTPGTIDKNELISTKYENSNLGDLSKYFHLNCSNDELVTCMVVQCTSSNLIPGSNGAHIAFDMQLNISNFEKILNKKRYALLSTYSAFEMEQNDAVWRVYGFASSHVFGSEQPSPPTPIWIYILSLVLGILVLVLISFVLYKYGFFKRKTKEELELLKNQEHSSDDVGTDSEDL
ncbi:integrin alpha-PS3-like [Arctopsyche grandis]|uniref:integrin alpha-PS3-like n=1 Tax=Arctopsyche grandis TaxID=121162 RepID=UPI00406D62FA